MQNIQLHYSSENFEDSKIGVQSNYLTIISQTLANNLKSSTEIRTASNTETRCIVREMIKPTFEWGEGGGRKQELLAEARNVGVSLGLMLLCN